MKARLGDALAYFERVAAEDQPGDLLSAKAGFYNLLLEGCGNVFVRQTLEGLYNRIALLRMTSMSQRGRLTHSIGELREIVRAIQAGEGAIAGEACRQHIHNAAAAALAGMDSPAR